MVDLSRLMVSVSGVRGRVGDGLTPEVVAALAAAFGAWVRVSSAGRGTDADRAAVVVGRDSRVSGPMFHRVVLSALESVGLRVIDVGLSTTPTIQLAVESHHAGGGIAITASHNPVEWNALKFIGPDGLFLGAGESAEMRKLLEVPPDGVAWDALGHTETDRSAIQRHIDAILRLPVVDVARIRARKVRVALDCCRGSGSLIMLPLLEALGCHVIAINAEPDGRFPRPPEPVAANLGELERLVQDTGAEVGFAVDPDVDRLAIVSGAGRAIGEDYTLALATRVVLQWRSESEGKEGEEGLVVVTNLSTSRVLDDVAAAFGATVLRTPVGEINVSSRIRSEGAAIGGEGNGGVILPELHLGRDAPLAAALVLRLLADEARPLAEVLGDYPEYVIVKDKVSRPSEGLSEALERVASAFEGGQVDRQDGLHISWQDSWVHVRPSGTEPIVRIIAEARSEAAATALVAAARNAWTGATSGS